MAKTPDRKPFTTTRFILTEGFEETAFTDRLIRERDLKDIEARANEDVGGIGGNSGFYKSLVGLETQTGFTEVKTVVFVCDNEADQKTSFNDVRRQIKQAKDDGLLQRNWGDPVAPFKKADGDPAVYVWMWHGTKPGCFDSALWECITSTIKFSAHVKCVEAALKCAKCAEAKWSKAILDKARVRCFISLICKDRPGVPGSELWGTFPNLIPVKDKTFTSYFRFLRDL